MEELSSRLTRAEKLDTQEKAAPTRSQSLRPNGTNRPPPALPEKPSQHAQVQRDVDKGSQKSESNVSNGVTVCLWSGQSSWNTFPIDAWLLLVIVLFST